jgi:hypothetical protein
MRGEGGLDVHVNVDCTYLLNELRDLPATEHEIVRYQFKFGLALCALGMLRHAEQHNQPADDATLGDDDLLSPEQVTEHALDGVASVIVPVIRGLASIFDE